MGARTKLNIAFINGALIVAAFVGMAFQSWMVFWGVVVLLVAGSLYAGEIRPTGQRRR